MAMASPQFTLRRADETHVSQVQELEFEFWRDPFVEEWGPSGLAYNRYYNLSALWPYGIYVAVDAANRVLGYVAQERISRLDLRPGMPPYNHDPKEFHRQHGSILYIINHTVRKEAAGLGVSKALIGGLQEDVSKPPIIRGDELNGIAVIWNHEHPFLKEPAKFWGRYGFEPLDYTRDENWGPVKGKRATGGTVWGWPPSYFKR